MSDGLEASRRTARRNVVLTAALAGLVGLLFGYDTGVIAVIGLFTLAFCWKFVPETKGKRLEDIQDFFQERVGKSGAASSAPASGGG